MYIGILHFKIK